MGYNFDKAQMKRVVLLLAVAGLLGVSCSKKVAAPQGETEVIVPCSGPEYRTNNKYIRASAVGLSGDMNMAKKKEETYPGYEELRAALAALPQLASSMNQLVERVAINYGNSYQVGESEEAKSKFEDMAKIVVKEKLSGLRIICEKTMRTSDGKYKVYIAAELAGDELMEGINSRVSKSISNDTKLRIDYDYEKFKKVFEEEMSKLAE